MRRLRQADAVYGRCMGRTNIDIDDELVETVMRRYGLRTKREAVDLALRRLAGPRLTDEMVRSLRGVGWDGDLHEMRSSRPPA
jgi:Arc/MetJ family transcription regulator